jgi:hypothetical protein
LFTGATRPLKYYRIRKIGEGRILLESAIGGSLAAPAEVGAGRNEDAPVRLSQVVQLLNDRFGTNFTATGELFCQQVRDDALANQNLQQAGAANTRHDFAYALTSTSKNWSSTGGTATAPKPACFFENPDVRSVIQNWMLDPLRFS